MDKRDNVLSDLEELRKNAREEVLERPLLFWTHRYYTRETRTIGYVPYQFLPKRGNWANIEAEDM